MTAPHVSVVVPTYNRANYLAQTLDSILAQTFQDFEIIIADDGSTDNTAEVVRAYDNARIHYHLLEHGGLPAALNQGLRAARGKYIGRIDSDDVWLPTLLAELVPVLENDARLGIVYARAQGMDANSEPLTQLLGLPERFPGETLKSLVYGDFITPIALVISSQAIAQAGGYDESLHGNEDWDLWLRIARNYGVAYVPRVLARYRYHAQGLTHAGSERMMRVMQDRVRVLDKFFTQPNLPENVLSIKDIAYRNVYLDWMVRALQAKQLRVAYNAFRRAQTSSPRPIALLVRAIGLACFTLYLSKTSWGVRLTESIVAQRRKALAA